MPRGLAAGHAHKSKADFRKFPLTTYAVWNIEVETVDAKPSNVEVLFYLSGPAKSN